VYEGEKLVGYEVDQGEAGIHGIVTVGDTSLDPSRRMISFQYTAGFGKRSEKKEEAQSTEVLINDMLPHFLVSHWEELMIGTSVKFRFIVLARAETVGFKLFKESETLWHGRSVVVIRMEPVSLILARLVEPIRFTVAKTNPHQILQYVGRTTPLIQRGNKKWEDLDAITIFDF
jgi:hypothetical protein